MEKTEKMIPKKRHLPPTREKHRKKKSKVVDKASKGEASEGVVKKKKRHSCLA